MNLNIIASTMVGMGRRVAVLGVLAIDVLSLNTLQATPEQISVYAPTTRPLAVGSMVSVRYKLTSGSTWWTAHPLMHISTTGNDSGAPVLPDAFAGTIFDLVANTSYDVEYSLFEPGQQTKVTTLTRTTRAPPAASGAANKNITTAGNLQTTFNGLVAGDVLELANGTYTVSSLTLNNSGSSGSPIYIRGQSRTGVIIKDTTGTVLSINASHVVVETLTIEGSSVDSGTASSSLGISIAGAHTNVTVRLTNMIGVDRGLVPNNVQTGLLVYENNWTGNNLWTTAFVDTNITWNDDGVTMPGYGNCCFQNTLTGFGDTFACAATQGDGFDSYGNHFYRNRIKNSGDDAIEFEYGTHNLSFYDNLITNAGTMMSNSPGYGGPIYCFRNVAVNLIRGPWKINPQDTGVNGSIIYSNTVVRTEGSTAYGMILVSNGATKNNSFRNNLLVYRGGTGDEFLSVLTGNNPIDFDHNAWYPDGRFRWFAEGTDYASLAAARSGLASITPLFGTVQRHVGDVITISNPFVATIMLGATHLTEYIPEPNLALSGGTTPKNAGIAIPGITDGFSGAAPDMGAVISGRSVPQYGATP